MKERLYYQRFLNKLKQGFQKVNSLNKVIEYWNVKEAPGRYLKSLKSTLKKEGYQVSYAPSIFKDRIRVTVTNK